MSREYLIRHEQLSPLGDQIRVLNNSNNEVSFGEVISSINTANNDLFEQVDLINELMSVLQDKIDRYNIGFMDGRKAANELDKKEDTIIIVNFNAQLSGYSNHITSINEIPNATSIAINESYNAGVKSLPDAEEVEY